MWMSSSGSRFLRIYLSSISKEYIYLASPKDILSSDTFNYLATVEFRAIAACRYWHLASYCIIFSLADLWFIYPTFSHQATSPAREGEGEGGEGDRSRSIHGKESTATGSDARADANYNCHSIWMPRSTAPHEENDVGFIQSFYQDHDYFFLKKKKIVCAIFSPFWCHFVSFLFVRATCDGEPRWLNSLILISDFFFFGYALLSFTGWLGLISQSHDTGRSRTTRVMIGGMAPLPLIIICSAAASWWGVNCFGKPLQSSSIYQT